MAEKEIKIPSKIETHQDGRWPIEKLYRSYFDLGRQPDFKIELILNFEFGQPKKSLPIIAISTKNTGQSLWIISGIHGEEPAGPIAIAKNIKIFKNLNKKGIPLVILPLCNPAGYVRNWRYLFSAQLLEQGKSIGESEHLLADEKNPKKTRIPKAPCRESEKFTRWVLKKTRKYPPLLVLDLHEDNPASIVSKEDQKEDQDLPDSTYIYSQGELGADDPVAKEIVKIMLKKKHPLYLAEDSETRFGEKVINGIVPNVKDGSVDEMLAAKEIIIKNKPTKGPSAKTVIVLETLVGKNIALKKRLKIHSNVLRSLKKFWLMLTKEKKPRLISRILPGIITSWLKLKKYIPHLR